MNTVIAGALWALCAAPAAEKTEAPVPIGSRLELPVDDALVESMTGQLRLEMHRPERRLW